MAHMLHIVVTDFQGRQISKKHVIESLSSGLIEELNIFLG